ncbi:site-specific integrase [Moraxella sp. ZY200743]|uniref:site-specific integrase n=1 Tax=Moraxella sp. ZY200743 TaxID=2911970 RepID=UPI003D7DAE35
MSRQLTPHRHGNKWRVKFSFSKQKYIITAHTEQECIHLAKQKLSILEQAKVSGGGLTFKQVATIYYEQHGQYLKSHRQVYYLIHRFIREYPNISNKLIQDITAHGLILWRNDRLQKVKINTVKTELSRLSAIFAYAKNELLIINENPFNKIKLYKTTLSRNRRVSENELVRLIQASKYLLGTKPKNNLQVAVWCFIFAINTCMRIGEILSIKAIHIHSNHIHIPITKNGYSRDVPLTDKAKEMLSWLDITDNLFDKPYKVSQISETWIRLTKKAGITDLHFHDSRHEGISRFVKDYQLPVQTLAKITGHRSLKVLLNTYYNPTVDEMLSMMKLKAQTHQAVSYPNHCSLDLQDKK